MKVILLLLLSFLIIRPVLFAQNSSSLKNQLLSADSVVVISYDHIAGTGDRQTLVDGKLNLSMLKEYKRLDSTGTRNLARIITQPFKDALIEEGRCWEPHHTIAVFKKDSISFITICFECEELVTSDDIALTVKDLDVSTWKKLRTFFKKNGVKYSIN